MTYSVKEIFLTLQGEGGQAGQPAVFCRFAGCNLWSGREEDRAAAVCTFCDTDFVGMDGEGGGRFATADLLAQAVEAAWIGGPDAPVRARLAAGLIMGMAIGRELSDGYASLDETQKAELARRIAPR